MLLVACKQAHDLVIRRGKKVGGATQEFRCLVFLTSPGPCSQAMIPEDYLKNVALNRRVFLKITANL